MSESSTLSTINNIDTIPFIETSADPIQIIDNFIDEKGKISIYQFLSETQTAEFAALLLYSVSRYPDYGLPFVQPIFLEESDEVAYLNLVFENCNWGEWKALELDLFAHETTTRGKVAVTCLKGLIE